MELFGIFLADPHPPWKSHGTLVNTPSKQTRSAVGQIIPPTHCENYLNHVTGLMPIASAMEKIDSKPKFESDARIFTSEPTRENLPSMTRLIATDLTGSSSE